jgi:hypothetical protein
MAVLLAAVIPGVGSVLCLEKPFTEVAESSLLLAGPKILLMRGVATASHLVLNNVPANAAGRPRGACWSSLRGQVGRPRTLRNPYRRVAPVRVG